MQKRYVMQWWRTAGWRIGNARTGKRWGDAYREMPSALLDAGRREELDAERGTLAH